MRKSTLVVVIGLLLHIQACKKGDGNSTPQSNSSTARLKTIEFPNPFSSTATTAVWDFQYSGDKMTRVNSRSGGYINIAYNGEQVSKLSYFLGSGTIPAFYQEFTYDGAGRLATNTLCIIRQSTGKPDSYQQLRYQYDGQNRVSRKDLFGDTSGGTSPRISNGHFEYVYGTDGTMKQMKRFDNVNVLQETEGYECNSNRNTLKDIFPRIDAMGIFMEAGWDYFDAQPFLENLYLSDYSVVKAGQLTSAVQYEFTYDANGDILQKKDNYGNVIKYTYE